MRRMVMLFVVLGMTTVTLTAEAEQRPLRFYGIGPRVGLSIDPDQFVFGGHADFGDLFPQTNLLFPVVEVGIGNDVTLASVGGDLLFRFIDNWGEWTPYAGGELALIFVSVDTPAGSNIDGTNTELGVSGIFGVEKGIKDNNKFALELKIGFVDTPDIKFTALWTFGR